MITGSIITSLIVANIGAYSTALAEDRHHREWVHVISFEAEEVDLGPDLDDINVSRKTLQLKTTTDMLFEIRIFLPAHREHIKQKWIKEGPRRHV